MKVAIKTLGCKLNQAESDEIIFSLSASGFQIVPFREPADIYLINSCAVTQEAERKTRQFVRQALRRDPSATIFLMGCYPRKLQIFKEADSFPGRVFTISSLEKKEELLKKIEELSGVTIIPSSFFLPGRVRAWLKVEEGCDHFCSYCLVSHLRGPVRSVPPERLLPQVKLWEEEGVREVVLTGINLGYYGVDLGGFRLIQLLRLLLAETSAVRFRLSSLEPFTLTREFIESYASLGPRVCPHFHLPLQSGSDRLLKKMRRGYQTAFFEEMVALIRDKMPTAGISTDLIVGFPGETDQDFQTTVRFCQKIAFSRAHVFIFSPRPGTPAERWEQKEGIPHSVKKRREKILLEVVRRTQEDFHRSFLNKKLPVLFESLQDGFFSGYSDNYLPVRVKEEGSPSLAGGKVWPVLVEKIVPFGLVGRVVQEGFETVDN
ncbi:MAG: threonylcarbamoyladenosine tRNA methylthiotransferase MtaB [Candidatus Atribacteria bacterium]|nr:threonylcarbamoyladenosine tRNA methylthiotransferase MtaB [Candidatus Atribacteria bacterium]